MEVVLVVVVEVVDEGVVVVVLGGDVPVAPPQRLVVGGTFRIVRNPAYLAAVSALVGQGLLLGSTDVLIYAGVMGLASNTTPGS